MCHRVIWLCHLRILRVSDLPVISSRSKYSSLVRVCLFAEQTTQVPPVASSTKKTIRPLKVTADNKNVTLPDNEVALYAYVMPPDTPGMSFSWFFKYVGVPIVIEFFWKILANQYQYEWRLISNPTEDTSEGTKEGQMTRRLHLMGLKQGTYVFQVTVKGTDTYGTANATVNVFPRKANHLK